MPGSGAVAVISDSFWQRRFDRSPSVIGKTVDVNLAPVTIIGVAPRGFSGASHVHTPQDLFLPLSMQPVIFPKKTVHYCPIPTHGGSRSWGDCSRASPMSKRALRWLSA